MQLYKLLLGRTPPKMYQWGGGEGGGDTPIGHPLFMVEEEN